MSARPHYLLISLLKQINNLDIKAIQFIGHFLNMFLNKII